MMEYATNTRRTVLKGIGAVAIIGTLAGCSSNGGNGGGGNDDDDGGSGNAEVDSYLSETTNYDGIEDVTGQSELTVDVGVEANDGPFGFGPAAIRIDAGTTVVWEWTGEGGDHNVVHEDGEFESELTDEEGFTFEYQFDEAGTSLYKCEPHASVGMKGAVIVE